MKNLIFIYLSSSLFTFFYKHTSHHNTYSLSLSLHNLQYMYTCLYSNILKTQDGFSGSGSGTPIKPNHLEIMGNGSAQRSTNGKVSYSSINFFISKFFVDLSYTFKKLILHLYILNFFF